MQYNTLSIIIAICFILLPSSLVYSWQIKNGGILSSTSLEEYQTQRITPYNTQSPDYYHPIACGGNAQSSGEDGLVVLSTNIGNDNTPMIIKSNYFMKENVIQEYIIPGNNSSAPYEQRVAMKLWGGGGGGCNGGRGVVTSPSPEEDDGIVRFNQGRAGGFVEATFSLPVGDKLYIVIGGGGKAEGSLSNSLGGRGGWHGGLDGRSDLSSGGGGGGGFTSISWNSTVVAAAFGGDGGGNTTYCKAQGGAGGVLRGKNKDSGGYINFDFDLALNDNIIEEEVIIPGIPEIEMLSHDAASFTWNAGTHRHKTTTKYYVQKYTVKLAGGIINDEDTEGIVCSNEDYRLHEHIQRGVDVNRNTTTHVNNLQSSSPYCIRVEAFSIEGLSLGVQVKHFTTKSTPVNKWHQITVRQRAVSTTSEVAVSSDASITDSFCEHSSSLPTGRRGHSMTVINDNVYIFGGATMKCVCTIDESTKERVCKSMNVYSDELWHFDPITSLFTQLDNESEHDDWPRSREQHSMTALPNGNLVLIGGISSTNDNAEIGEDSSELLSDVWIMKDPHHVSSHVFSMIEDESIELKAGQVTSHTLPISLNNEMDDDMCVSYIQVRITIDQLSCPKAIEYIKLTAPEVIDNKDYETKLFVGSIASRDHECSSSSVNLVFTDDSHYDSVLSRASTPTSGTFRPADSLMQTFGGLDGDWKISIGISQPIHPEVYEGTLNDWKVIVDVKPCSTHPRWEKLASPPLAFEPRRLHTAIAVDNSIFISGGFAQGRLTDMWRFDYDDNSWTELNSHQGVAWPMYGQAAYIGEFGLLSYGGLAPHGPRTPGEDLWLWDIFADEWSSLPVAQNDTSVHDDQLLSNDIPQGRYLSSISLLDNAHSSSEGPSVLVFGGDNGLLHNSHQDSYGYMSNSFLDDLWLLSPDGMHISSPMKNGNHRENYCSWMMKDGSTAEQAWNVSCGWKEEGSPPGVCGLKDVLIAAWCRKQYQSLTVS